MNQRAIDSQPGQRLLEIRQHREMSQGRLAEAIGVTVGTIQNYEHGRVVIGVDRIEQLARALQCEMLDLLMPSGSPLPRYFRSVRKVGRLPEPALRLGADPGHRARGGEDSQQIGRNGQERLPLRC